MFSDIEIYQYIFNEMVGVGDGKLFPLHLVEYLYITLQFCQVQTQVSTLCNREAVAFLRQELANSRKSFLYQPLPSFILFENKPKLKFIIWFTVTHIIYILQYNKKKMYTLIFRFIIDRNARVEI